MLQQETAWISSGIVCIVLATKIEETEFKLGQAHRKVTRQYSGEGWGEQSNPCETWLIKGNITKAYRRYNCNV